MSGNSGAGALVLIVPAGTVVYVCVGSSVLLSAIGATIVLMVVAPILGAIALLLYSQLYVSTAKQGRAHLWPVLLASTVAPVVAYVAAVKYSQSTGVGVDYYQSYLSHSAGLIDMALRLTLIALVIFGVMSTVLGGFVMAFATASGDAWYKSLALSSIPFMLLSANLGFLFRETPVEIFG